MVESVVFEVVALGEVVLAAGLTKGVYPVGLVVGLAVMFDVVDENVGVFDGAEVVLMVLLLVEVVESAKLGVVTLKSASHFFVMWGLQGSHSLVPSYKLIYT
jgi:hypothetical protein